MIKNTLTKQRRFELDQWNCAHYNNSSGAGRYLSRKARTRGGRFLLCYLLTMIATIVAVVVRCS